MAAAMPLHAEGDEIRTHPAPVVRDAPPTVHRVPRPKGLGRKSSPQNSFPAVNQMIQEEMFADFYPLLPAPLLVVPKVPRGVGHRVRKRWQRAREIALRANSIFRALNKLDSGLRITRTRRRTRSIRFTPSMKALHRRVWELAAAAMSVRLTQDLIGLGGAQSAAMLLKADQTDRYSFQMRTRAQVPILALALDEPAPNWPTVPMLEALPWDEAKFYEDERHVVDFSGKTDILFQEIQARYCFVGGSYEQYTAYFNRVDIDPDLWSWCTATDVKCVNGFSGVPKKDRSKQRKLLMTCGPNYLWSSARDRSELGMLGGAGLTGLYAPDGDAFLASWDQSNAFTAVRTPSWWWPWMAVPPVRAGDVWDRLPRALQRRSVAASWVYPRYTRLPMGGSHSVHILMTINLEVVGRTLTRSARLGSFDSHDVPNDRAAQPTSADEHADPRDDELWAEAHFQKRLASHCWDEDRAMPKTLQEFLEAARTARRVAERVFVVMHLFSGPHRECDLESFVRSIMRHRGMKVLVISVDLDADANWDLSDPHTFHALHEAVLQGYIDAVVGGPPCSTWSRLRFRPGGPRPLRFRWQPWGRSDATAHERDRLVEGNVLIVNFMALCESVAVRGGLYLWEHPDDPGCDPYPSVWATGEYLAFENRVGGHRCLFDQCPLGADVKKPTCVSTNIEDVPEIGPRCPGLSAVHAHDEHRGKEQGVFSSRRLSQYPPAMCEWLAGFLCTAFGRWQTTGEGPTGWLRRVAKPILASAEDPAELHSAATEAGWRMVAHGRWERTRSGSDLAASNHDSNRCVFFAERDSASDRRAWSR